MLFALKENASHSATRDIDFLSFGRGEIEDLVEVFREVRSIEVKEDGVNFVSKTIKGKRIKAEQEYEGVSIHVLTLLEKTRIPLGIDVGFDDVVEPEAGKIEPPTLLDFPDPKIKIYAPETVTAEEFHVMLDLGMTNSRHKYF